MPKLSAAAFTKRLIALKNNEELKKHERYFKFVGTDQDSEDYFIGVRMGSIFELGKEFREMPVDEIEVLLESPIHELRVGAMSIMGQSVKGKKCSEQRIEELQALSTSSRPNK